MNGKSIYNKIPEGYVPVPKEDKSKSLSLLRQGSITEITIDGKTFQVHDPARVEKIIQMVERHEERFFSIGQELSRTKQKCTMLENQINKLSNTVSKLQEQIKNAGFDKY
jgi:chromosome segregation ATPase